MTEELMQSEQVETTNVLSSDTGIETSESSSTNEHVEHNSDAENDTSIGETHTPSETSESQDVNSNAENAKKRIDKKGRKLQRLAEQLEAENAQLRQQMQSVQPQQQQQQQFNQAPAVPQQIVDPFTGEHLSPGTQRYETVLYDQQKQMAHEQRQMEALQHEAQQHQKKLDEQFRDDLDDAEDRYDDFREVVFNNDLPFQESMINVAKIAPNSADLLYYLGKNPKEVHRISKLNPIEQQREVAKHAIQFASRKQVSNAPPPVKTVGDTPGAKSKNSFSSLARDASTLRKHMKESRRRIKS